MLTMLKSAVRIVLGFSAALLTMGLLSERVVSWQYAEDPVFGDVFKPGGFVRYRLEGDGLSQWTEHGIRRSSYPETNSRPVVLVVGDSMVEALQVDDEEVFTTVVEKQLATRWPAVAVLNVGRSGLSVADYIAMVPLYVPRLKPDWAVVVVTALDFQEDAWRGSQTHFQHDPDGTKLTIVSPPSARTPKRGRLGQAILRLRNTCGLAQFTAIRLRQFQSWVQQETPWFHAGKSQPKSQRDPLAEDDRYPMGEELDMLVRAYQGRLTLVLLDRYSSNGLDSNGSADSRLKRLATGRGLSFVALSDGFGAFTNSHRAPYGFSNSRFNYGHLNADGHRVLAALLTAELERMLANRDLH